MAKPIEPTPVLKGDDAYEFVASTRRLLLRRRLVWLRVRHSSSLCLLLLSDSWLREDEDCTPDR